MITTIRTIRTFIAFAATALAASLLTSTASAQAVKVSVDWNTTLKTIDPGAWGLDVPGFFVPADTASKSYMCLVNDITLRKPLIRMHGWGMVSKDGGRQLWLNADGTWNASKISSALAPVISAGYTLMIDVPDGPNNTGGGKPDPDLIKNPEKIAAWLASLVQIVNVTNHFHVKYWEFPNEREDSLTAAQMSTLLNKCSVAMKAVDPTIKVGGPAVMWINTPYITTVVKNCGTNIDFVSCHRYGGDGSAPSPQKYYDSAQEDAAGMAQLRSALDAVSKGRRIPIHFDEYDIAWGASAYNKTSDGAVYDILEATGAIHNGADTTQHWVMDDCDRGNSLVKNLTMRYPMSNYLTMLNRFFYGQEVSSTTTNNKLVDRFAAKSTEGSTTTYALVLVNRSDSPQNVELSYAGFKPKKLDEYVIDSKGFSGREEIGWPIRGGFSMAPRTVAYVVGTSGGHAIRGK